MEANLFVVGGPISVGKSTLVDSLDFPQVPELDEGNKLQMILLENTYSKKRVAAEVIELFFLQTRIEKYKEFSNTLNTHILDRSIFESLWFAKENMDEKSFQYFKKLWIAEIKELIKNFGKPKLYILLTMDWETFKHRFFLRGRNVEVKNFESNETFFKKHIKEYEEHMKKIFIDFNINHAVINTDNMSAEEVKEQVENIIKGVIDE